MSKKAYENKWTFGGKPFESDQIADHLGFVYMIIDNRDGRKYIGQKKFLKRVKRAKGKVTVESDWKHYWGSSLELQNEVAVHGQHNFSRIILHLCHTKSEMNYIELREQMLNDVLLKDGWYNGYVGTRISRKHLEKYRKKLQQAS